jgi:hypothetical protein
MDVNPEPLNATPTVFNVLVTNAVDNLKKPDAEMCAAPETQNVQRQSYKDFSEVKQYLPLDNMSKYLDLEHELSDGELIQKFVSFCRTFSPPFYKTSFKTVYFVILFQISFISENAPEEIENAQFAGVLFKDLFQDNFLVNFFNWSDRLGKVPLQNSMLVTKVLQRQLDLKFIS